MEYEALAVVEAQVEAQAAASRPGTTAPALSSREAAAAAAQRRHSEAAMDATPAHATTEHANPHVGAVAPILEVPPALGAEPMAVTQWAEGQFPLPPPAETPAAADPHHDTGAFCSSWRPRVVVC
jgi:hypothetical protein